MQICTIGCTLCHLLKIYFSVLRLPSSLEKVEGEVLFLQSKITEVLGGSGYNTERLATPYIPQYTGNHLELFKHDNHPKNAAKETHEEKGMRNVY